MFRRIYWLVLIGAAFFPSAVSAHANHPIPVKPEYARQADVVSWSKGFADKLTFPTFEASHLNGGFLAAGDLDGDDVDEIIVGSGPGRAPEVRIYSSDGQLIRRFWPYPSAFHGGVRVASGDLDADGRFEIVTAPGPGMEPRLKVFDSSGKEIVADGGLAYHPALHVGVRLAIHDIDADGQPEILTAPGPGGRAHIRAFDKDLKPTGFSLFAFDSEMKDGAGLAVLRTAAGSLLAVAPESWATSTVRLFAFDGRKAPLYELQPFPDASSTRLGLTIAAYDADADGQDELVAARNGQAVPEIRIVDINGAELGRYLAADQKYRGALSFTSVKADGSGIELAVMPLAPLVIGPLDKEKFIEVNLAQQRLYAWEHGRLARTFLVSTGVKKYPTPVMETKVLKKIPMMDYKGYYGPNHPDNYDIKNVKNNLRIRGSILIHYAFWHRNFGHPMSHGCINVGNADSDWLFAWAEVGTPVATHH
jgi:hypothetical protein